MACLKGIDKDWGSAAKEGIEEMELGGVQVLAYRDRPASLAETLRRAADKYPDKECIIDGDRRVTYRDFFQMVQQAAGSLRHEYGVQKGDRVATLMVNTLEFCVAFYATQQLGAVAVPLNTYLKSMELEFLLENSQSRILVMNSQWWPNVEPIAERIPTLEKIFFTERSQEIEQGLPPGAALYEELFTRDHEEIQTEMDEHDTAAIVYTSGTTGQPKGAMISHFNAMHCAISYERCFGLTENERTLIVAPFFHVTGLFAQLATLVYMKGTAVLMPRFSVEEKLRLIEREKITNVGGTPTMYVMCMASPLRDSFDVSSVRIAGYGGAPMAEEDIRRLRAWMPNVRLYNTYGSTETTSPTSILPDRHVIDKGHTVGWPVPVAEVKVMDPAAFEELDCSQAGELWVRGPMVISGYWRNREGTEAALQNGWIRTGDVAVIDEDGFVSIVDRLKDMINRGGEKVFSVEVENVISLNPKVMEVAVVGVPDETYGETVKALVVPFPGQEIEAGEIRQWVADRMARFKVPQYVEILQQLPRNPGGKVIKSELRYIPEGA